MTIHFICTGNLYRSRLAEAYCASRKRQELIISSSGIRATLNSGMLIAPHASRLLKERGLESFAAVSWQQTTAALVRASDVLVFMQDEHFHFCEEWIDPMRQRVEIWGIQDVQQVDARGIRNEVEHTFENIRQRTDLLLAAL